MSYIYPNQPLNFYYDSENSSQANSPVRIASVSKIKNGQYHFLKISPGLVDNDEVTFSYNSMPYALFSETLEKVTNNHPIPLKLDNNLDSLSEVFPISVRMVTQDNSYIVERPPFRTTIRFAPVRASKASSSKNIHVVDVWVPWTVYKIQYHDNGSFTFRMYINHSPISSLDDNLFSVPFANAFNDGSICFGSDQHYINDHIRQLIESGSIDLKSVFSNIIGTYFNGGWNADVLPGRYTMPSFFYPKAELKDDTAQAIYNTAFSKIIPSKTRYNSIRDYVDLLNIWSQYSLDDLLYLFKIESENPHYSRSAIKVNSLIKPLAKNFVSDKIDYFKQLSCQTNFDIFDLMRNTESYFYEKNKDLVKSLVFKENPLTNSPVLSGTIMSQEYLYQILDYVIETMEKQYAPSVEVPFNAHQILLSDLYQEEPF